MLCLILLTPCLQLALWVWGYDQKFVHVTWGFKNVFTHNETRKPLEPEKHIDWDTFSSAHHKLHPGVHKFLSAILKMFYSYQGVSGVANRRHLAV